MGMMFSNRYEVFVTAKFMMISWKTESHELLGKAGVEFGFNHPMGGLRIPFVEDVLLEPA
jgi:hypothetical protein